MSNTYRSQNVLGVVGAVCLNLADTAFPNQLKSSSIEKVKSELIVDFGDGCGWGAGKGGCGRVGTKQ
eukprot:1505094-Amphidinium_carterae.1